MRRLSTIGLAALLLASAALARPHFYREQWKQALEIGGGNPGWVEHPPVVVLSLDGPMQIGPFVCAEGQYQVELRVAAGGEIVHRERVYLWVDSLPDRDHALLHEFLHAVWWRRTIASRAFERKYPDSEKWVRGILRETPQLARSP